eukprot:1159855-Pelagomonas_calceolata.AAC.10
MPGNGCSELAAAAAVAADTEAVAALAAGNTWARCLGVTGCWVCRRGAWVEEWSALGGPLAKGVDSLPSTTRCCGCCPVECVCFDVPVPGPCAPA